jgi:hypothetical protein
MEKVLVFIMVFCACNGLIRQLPKGEPTTSGGTKVKLRMPGIIPQKVNTFQDIKTEYIN